MKSRAAEQRAWRAANPDKYKASRARYLTKNRDRVLALRRARRIENTYGITADEYARRITACGGRCEVCGGEPGGRWKKLFVDHDHNTGEVRGMLCINCNLAIGYLGDDPDRARSVAAYLERGKKL